MGRDTSTVQKPGFAEREGTRADGTEPPSPGGSCPYPRPHSWGKTIRDAVTGSDDKRVWGGTGIAKGAVRQDSEAARAPDWGSFGGHTNQLISRRAMDLSVGLIEHLTDPRDLKAMSARWNE
jgi:hypothetical protein